MAVVCVGGASEAHGGAVGVVGAAGPGARGPGGGGGGGRGGRRRAAALLDLMGDPDGPAPRLLEAVAVGEQRQDALGPPLHAGAPVEALVVDVVEAPEVVHGGQVRQELAGEVLRAVGEQELEDHERLVDGPPLLPVLGYPLVQHLGYPPAVVHVEGRVGDAGKRPDVREASIIIGSLLDQPTIKSTPTTI